LAGGSERTCGEQEGFVKSSTTVPGSNGDQTMEPNVTAFVCANCAREVGACAPQIDPITAIFQQKATVKEVVVPCTGRLQPEHLLRAIEGGADLVCVIACEENNCHFIEGAVRARRRGEYVQHLLEEIEVGGERILLLHLPGSARQDMSARERGSEPQGGGDTAEFSRYVMAASAEVAERLRSARPNPLKQPPAEAVTDSPTEENEENED
jgi:F420-non-reducing hydrogenase iron-sulfur subunit